MTDLENPSNPAHAEPTSMTVTLRPLDDVDIGFIVSWRNDPATRSQSRRQHALTWNDLVNAPNGGHRETLIALRGRTRVGYVHLDRHDAACELSWVVAPAHRGKGIGTLIVEAAIAVAGCDEVTAEIRPLNAASIRIAKRCGFVLAETRSDLLLWRRRASGVKRAETQTETRPACAS